MQEIPRDGSFDSTFSLLREGYGFIGRRCQRLQSDVFRSRLMLRDVVCMRGPHAAMLFYGDTRLTRVGGMPTTVLRLLQDKGSVQQLDGHAHRHRKALFARLLMEDEESLARLVDIFRERSLRRLAEWQQREQIEAAPEIGQLLAETAFQWTSTPMAVLDKDPTVLSDMVQNAGHFGPRTWWTLRRRTRLEAELEKTFDGIRNGSVQVAEGSPIAAIAWYRDEDGALLPASVAAVELLNILRPIVAIARYIVFAALALHNNPAWCDLFETGNDEFLDDFAEEVRRCFPFFPFVGAVAKQELDWQGYGIQAGQWLLCDLYGTMHDPRFFPEPDQLKPQRQLSWKDQNYSFIPQGAGKTAATHRCPGERITIDIMKESVKLFCRHMTYEIAPQDLSIPLDEIPTGPRSGLIMTNIRKAVSSPG